MILGQLADRVAAAIWNLHPCRAVAVGRHEYDGQVPDLSAGAVEAGLERLGRLRAQLDGLAGLSPEEQAEREVLGGAVDRERFDGEWVRRWRRDPAWYLEALDVSTYLERDYAPPGLRLEQAVAVLAESGAALSAARENLNPDLPRAWVEHAAARARDLARRLGAQAEWAPDAASAPAEASWLRGAAAGAAAELEAYAAWLEAERLPAATDDFALGAEGLAGWWRAAEGLDAATDDLEATGRALLEADRAGGDPWPPGPPVPGSGARAEGAENLQEAGERARRFVLEQGLAAVPDGFAWRTALGYPGAGAGDGWLQAPGPYDDPATPAVLYLAPEAAGRPGAAESLAISEGFPGRLLLTLRAARVPGEARRRFPSAGSTEGWVLYAADLMREAGFRASGPAWDEVRRRTLLAGCRLCAVAGLHAGTTTVKGAAGLFVAEAGLDERAAHQEALHCAADPGAAAAGLGRALLRRLQARHGGPPGEFPSAWLRDRLLPLVGLPLGRLGRLAAS